jgi:hypothetical protein
MQNDAGHGYIIVKVGYNVAFSLIIVILAGKKSHEIALLIILNILIIKVILEMAYSQQELFWIRRRHYLAFD